MILRTHKSLQLSFICCFWLSTLGAQPIYYEFELDQLFRLSQVNAVMDPYLHSTEVVWKFGDNLNLDQEITESIPILIRKDRTDENGKDLLIVEDYFGVSSKIIENSGYAANELGAVFDNIEFLTRWTETELGNSKGDIHYNWSKGKIKKINEFLLKSNDSIISDLLSNSGSLSELEHNSIDFWLWFRKYSLYLHNPFVLIDVDSVYAQSGKHKLNTDLFKILLPAMRLSNYKQILSLNLSEIELGDLTVNNLYENSKMSQYYYASFLYCLKRYYPMYENNTISKVAKDTIVVDTNVLFQTHLPELDYVLRIYRQKDYNVNIDYRFIDQDLKSLMFRELLTSRITVLEFWGTWCKPCIESMPLYLELATKYQRRIPFVSIAIDKKEKWLKYLSSNPSLSSLQLLNEDHISGFYSPGISVFPTYMMIDQNGKLLGSPVNSIDELKTKIEKLEAN